MIFKKAMVYDCLQYVITCLKFQKRGNTESCNYYYLIAHFPWASPHIVYYDRRTRFCFHSNCFRPVKFTVNSNDMTV